MSELKQEFENWAISHGGLSLIPANDGECGNGWFPATYAHSMTEIAWRAFANRRTQPEATKPAQELTLENAPIGTKAPAIMGGSWTRTELGWKWDSGSTFPRPGGDWNGKLIAPAQDLSAAILAMNRAKLLPIWDNDVPHKLHVELDVIFKALAALASPADALVAGDSERMNFMFEHEAMIKYNPESTHCRVLVQSEDGDLIPIDGLIDSKWYVSAREAIDAAIQAQKDGHG